MSEKPTVMCFSGLDPTGGAGIQADIETLFSLGCHCVPLVTALTVQNTQNVLDVSVTDCSLLNQQSRAILEDMMVHCFKLGYLGSVENIEVIYALLKDYANIPVVLDPISLAGGGFELAGEDMLEALRELIIPLTTVLTPNTMEARKLAPSADTLSACANEMMDRGCKHVLITGTHAQTEEVVNRHYSSAAQASHCTWPRLEPSYHGSGCTLSAAIAGNIARQLPLPEAIERAQRFTWESLSSGRRVGFGQHLPDRGYWHSDDDSRPA